MPFHLNASLQEASERGSFKPGRFRADEFDRTCWHSLDHNCVSSAKQNAAVSEPLKTKVRTEDRTAMFILNAVLKVTLGAGIWSTMQKRTLRLALSFRI
jgi:hypothetical protein